MFQNQQDLCDIVSLVLWCREDDTFLLINDEFGYWILSAKVEKGVSWRDTAKILLTKVSYKGEISKCCKQYRIWNPSGEGEIHHTVFTVEISPASKGLRRDSYAKYSMFWLSSQDIERSYWLLRSPELLDVISSTKNTILQRPKQESSCSVHSEGHWSELIDDSPLNDSVEILERHVFPDIQNSPHESLLQSSGLTKTKQLGLYMKFLVLCLPCTLMNVKVFTNLVGMFGWDPKHSYKLFYSADLSQDGYLSFRDVLYILAAAEPLTAHAGITGELRTRYIFRYYDTNRDDLLEADEFTVLINDIIHLKKNSIRPRDICHFAIPGGSDHAITFKAFMKLVGNLKLRGTSLLLRSPISINAVCPEINDKVKFVKSFPEVPELLSTTATRGVTFFSPPDEVSHLSPMFQCTGPNKNSKSDFGVSLLCVKLSESGSVISTTDASQRRSSRDFSPRNVLTIRKSYTSMYKKHQKELLQSVQYFVQDNIAKDDEGNFGSKGRSSLSCGSTNPSTIATNLLKVCEGVSHILSMERRLVKLKPPVSVMGELHGNFCDLLCFEKAFWNLGPTLSPTTLLFLGNYVDHGTNGFEVIAYLLARKLESPDKIILLRGSRDIRVFQHSFSKKCTEMFGKTMGRQVWEALNSAIDCMPLAAIIDHQVFCTHGGIPPPWLCPVVSTINNIPCPLPNPDKQSPLSWELMWNEPLKKSVLNDIIALELEAKEGFATNPLKGTGHLFDVSALKNFLKINGLSVLLRCHENEGDEFSTEMSELMLTLNSRLDNSVKSEASCVYVNPRKIISLKSDSGR